MSAESGFEEWAARAYVDLVSHLNLDHLGAAAPVQDCIRCVELVLRGEESVARRREYQSQRLRDLLDQLEPTRSQVVDIYIGGSETPRAIGQVSFPPGARVGQVSCHECGGTGWWGYGPAEDVNGPCVDCKGTGLEWVGLA